MNKVFGSRSFISFFVFFLVTLATIIFIWLIFPKEPAPVSLRILGDSFSGYSTFRDSDFQEALKKSQIGLTYEDEPDQKKRSERLKAGNADLIVTTLDQFIKQESFLSGKIVGLIDRSNGADAVLLNTKKYPNLKSLPDLRQLAKTEKEQGRKLSITFAGDTPSEFLAISLSAKEKFKLSDFEIIEEKDAIYAWQRLQNSPNVAIAVLWEPFVTQAKKQGYIVAFSSEDETTSIIDVIVASNKLLRYQSDAVSQFLVAYYNQIHAQAFDSSLMQKKIAKDANLSLDDAEAIRKNIYFFTSLETNDWLTNNKLDERIKYISNLLLASGKIVKIPENPKDLFTNQPIAASVTKTKEICKTLNDLSEIQKRICKIPSNAPTSTSSPSQQTGKQKKESCKEIAKNPDGQSYCAER